jgi:hypothetical protein
MWVPDAFIIGHSRTRVREMPDLRLLDRSDSVVASDPASSDSSLVPSEYACGCGVADMQFAG